MRQLNFFKKISAMLRDIIFVPEHDFNVNFEIKNCKGLAFHISYVVPQVCILSHDCGINIQIALHL